MTGVNWRTEARNRLREAGYRPGAARARLIDYLATQSCCQSAQEIHAELAARGGRIGLASVYRALDMLVEHGLVQRVDIGDGTARYETSQRTGDHHHHLVCAECGKVEPFADRSLEKAIGAVQRRSTYAVVAHEVVLRGTCAECGEDQ
jgi:Fur family ferric uptake transcriptional regulator